MKNFPTDYNRIPDLKKYPELVFLNRYDQIVPFAYGALMLGIGALLEFSVSSSSKSVGIEARMMEFSVSLSSRSVGIEALFMEFSVSLSSKSVGVEALLMEFSVLC